MTIETTSQNGRESVAWRFGKSGLEVVERLRSAWHGPWPPCHETCKRRKNIEKRSARIEALRKAKKPIVYNGFKASCSLLRNVWRNLSLRLPSDLPNRPLLRPAHVLGGAGFLFLLTLGEASAQSPGPWKAADQGWTSGSSFDASPAPSTSVTREAPAGSSFQGIEAQSSFDLAPRTQRQRRSRPFVLPDGDDLRKVRALIEYAESSAHGYDAYHLSARIPPPRRPTQMTLDEIAAWIKATPGQHHAIGRYQFIPSTLADLVRRTGLSGKTVFNTATQDLLANVLIADAGYIELKQGALPLPRFMDNLARIWAGFPLQTGRSAYHGYAGNRATVTLAEYRRHMGAIFPKGVILASAE